MGLQVDWKDSRTNITIPNAYLRVSGMTIMKALNNKWLVTFQVKSWGTKVDAETNDTLLAGDVFSPVEAFTETSYTFDPSDDADDLIDTAFSRCITIHGRSTPTERLNCSGSSRVSSANNKLEMPFYRILANCLTPVRPAPLRSIIFLVWLISLLKLDETIFSKTVYTAL